MKRFSLQLTDPEGDDTCMLESLYGPWVRYEDAQAEIERLRFLVNCAYIEGYLDGVDDHGKNPINRHTVAERWDASEAKAILTEETRDEH